MALADSGHAQTGTQVEVDVRGRRVAAEIVPLPFYKRGRGIRRERRLEKVEIRAALLFGCKAEPAGFVV